MYSLNLCLCGPTREWRIPLKAIDIIRPLRSQTLPISKNTLQSSSRLSLSLFLNIKFIILKKKEKIACTAFLYFVFFYLIVIPPGDYSHVSIPYGLLFLTPISYSCDRRCRFSVTLQSINNHVFEL